MLEFMQPVADTLGLSLEICLILTGVVASIVGLLVINQVVASLSDTKRAPSHSKIELGQTQKRKTVRDRFLLAGPAFAGKTQLYYKLIGGSIGDSVSSSEINETETSAQVKVPARLVQSTPSESTYVNIEAKFVDIPGHFNFRKSILIESSGAKAIIVLLDAKDKTKFGEAAEILYDLLGDIEVIDQQVPILVACNKSDLAFAKNALQIERELTNEIE